MTQLRHRRGKDAFRAMEYQDANGKSSEYRRPERSVTIAHVGDGGIKISLGDALPYLEQRFLELIGQD